MGYVLFSGENLKNILFLWSFAKFLWSFAPNDFILTYVGKQPKKESVILI